MRGLFIFLFLLSPISYIGQAAYGDSLENIVELAIRGIPLGEDEKIVRDLFSITIPGHPGAYNPSILPLDDGFLLSFRDQARSLSVVGLVRLNKNSSLLESNRHLEDARLFRYDGKIWATCTNLTGWYPIQTHIVLCQIDLNTPSFTSVVDLDYHLVAMEKNWVPLRYKDAEGIENLYLVYAHNPFHVRKVVSSIKGITEGIFLEERKRDVPWEKKWGRISGGTPCISLGKEQLAFFHSHFSLGYRKDFYVIGAVTFENTPPFRIKKISPHPIIARGMYPDYSPLGNIHVVFPGGVVRIKKNEEQLLYVVYGENDSRIKVMVVDEKELLNSLVDFPG